jgi:hypothetical protein
MAKRAAVRRKAPKRGTLARKVPKRKVPKGKVAKRTARAPTAPKRGWSVAEPVPALDLFDAMPASGSTVADAGDDASLHDLFQQQTMAMLDRSDLDEEQKQSILVAMNCPCCGGSGLSFTMKLKRKR